MKAIPHLPSRAARLGLLFSLCSLWPLWPGGEALAQSELQKPYRLDVVLHVSNHRLLTDVFRDRVGGELRDGLQAALGDLARVRLLTEHPRLPDVLRRGLRQSLDSWDEKSDVKTHFVLIDFVGGHYEIQARQHDGLTGASSPAVRIDRTRDRDFVARTAAVLVEHDFGLVGTVQGEPDGSGRVRVLLRGGALASLARLVNKGDVFFLVPPAGARPLEWALLQVQDAPRDDARDGVCTCRFHDRYKARAIRDCRCLGVGTTEAPLRLRWMQQGPRGGLVPLKQPLFMDLRHSPGEDLNKLSKKTDEDGLVDTSGDGEKGLFSNVAFVNVTGGMAQPWPSVPVAVLDDQPVVIGVNATHDKNTLLSIHKATWERNVSDSLLVQIELFQEIKALSSVAEKRGEVLRRAEEGLRRSRDDYARLTNERTLLVQEAGKTKLDLARDEQRLAELKKGEGLLEKFVEEQKKIEDDEKDPEKQKFRQRVAEARLLETNLEVERALEIYKQVLDAGYDDPALKKYYEELAQKWKPADDTHRQAREFIYQTWPKLDTRGLKERMEEAHKALAVCKKAGDLISIRKLLKGTEAHALRLTKELGALAPDVNIEDERQARLLKEVSDALLKLADEIQRALPEKG